MKRGRQILAIMGIAALLLMYASTMVFALMDHPQAEAWARASLMCTMIVPVFLYAFILALRVFGKSKVELVDESQIDTVVLDIGKVLAEYDWHGFLEKKGYEEDMIERLGDAVFRNNDWEVGDNGILTDEEILQSFIDNDPELETEIRDIFDTMGGTIETFSYTRQWLQELRDMNLNIYYLSNYSHPLYERTKEELSFLQELDGGYMSHEIYCMKPGEEIYQKLLNDFDLDPARCVFIDDRLENVVGARNVGMHAIHFTGYEEVQEELRQML